MKATETTILNFIGGLDKVFIIPPFQRNYEWTHEQCEELFNDIVKAYNTQKGHYLGNVVYYIGKNHGASYSEFILVDGQQRVTSILLLLCALRDYISSEDIASSINRRYLLNDTADNRFRIRLKQTNYDTKSFMSIIDKLPIENTDNNIAKNYTFFTKLLSSSTVTPKDLYETLTKLEVVEVNLQIENDLTAIQTVFEKINSTGKRLTPADLIRNYLLLANSSAEQDRLYEDYWIKIEQYVKGENISKFAKDYLIMNIFEDVPEAKIYKMFKDHFVEVNALHIDILRDMYVYSKYFAWVKYEICPNEKINQIIKYLNYIKTEDVYPLYMYLMAKLYENNLPELEKIMRLICDYMLRYRIVSPAGGGGSLRAVVQQLLEKLNSGGIQLCYDDIYFELSNSNTPSGRYPNDEEFIETLINSVNTNYAKAVLLRIEEKETKNIPVELTSVTVEHLLPQTLNSWWHNHLGSKIEAEEISENYLNSLGNLTPISQGYNSKISNKPWNEKVKELANVQFKITYELTSYTEWKEENIKNRSIELAKRACIAVTPPLVRTRKYQTKTATADFTEGVYPLSDITTPMAGGTPICIMFDSKIIEISAWNEIIPEISKVLLEVDGDLFANIVAENKIHKSTSKKNYPAKDPIITSSEALLGKASPIDNSSYFVEANLSSGRARVYAKQLLDFYEMADMFQISVINN